MAVITPFQRQKKRAKEQNSKHLQNTRKDKIPELFPGWKTKKPLRLGVPLNLPGTNSGTKLAVLRLVSRRGSVGATKLKMKENLKKPTRNAKFLNKVIKKHTTIDKQNYNTNKTLAR